MVKVTFETTSSGLWSMERAFVREIGRLQECVSETMQEKKELAMEIRECEDSDEIARCLKHIEVCVQYINDCNNYIGELQKCTQRLKYS